MSDGDGCDCDTRDPMAELAEAGVAGVRFDVVDALRAIESELGNGRPPTGDQVRDLRKHVHFLLHVTEEMLADAADDTEPWEQPPSMPYCVWNRYPERD